MNLTVPGDISKNAKDLYRAITPKKRRKFSETMIRRRTPFLLGEKNELNLITDEKQATKPKITSSPLYIKLNNKENDITCRIRPCRKLKTDIDPLKSNTNIIDIHTLSSAKGIAGLDSPTCQMLCNDNHKLKGKTESQRKLLKVTPRKAKAKNEENLTRETESHMNPDEYIYTEKKPDDDHNLIGNETLATSDYYSDGSKSETIEILTNSEDSNDLNIFDSESSVEHSFNYILDENIKPSLNSTIISQSEAIRNEKDFPRNASFSQTMKENNKNETYTLPSKKLENETNDIKNKILKSDKSTAIKESEPNSRIPLIIINETDVTNNVSQTHETNLKIPCTHILTKYQGNRELQKKVIEIELFKQIEIKDRVMDQLLEMAATIGFPHLRHCCKELYKEKEDCSCTNMSGGTLNIEKQVEEPIGFFDTLWSSIKYLFITNPIKYGKINRDESNKEEKEKNNCFTNSKEKMDYGNKQMEKSAVPIILREVNENCSINDKKKDETCNNGELKITDIELITIKYPKTSKNFKDNKELLKDFKNETVIQDYVGAYGDVGKLIGSEKNVKHSNEGNVKKLKELNKSSFENVIVEHIKLNKDEEKKRKDDDEVKIIVKKNFLSQEIGKETKDSKLKEAFAKEPKKVANELKVGNEISEKKKVLNNSVAKPNERFLVFFQREDNVIIVDKTKSNKTGGPDKIESMEEKWNELNVERNKMEI